MNTQTGLGHQRALLRKALRLVSHHIRMLADQRRDIDKTERVIREIINEALGETDKLP